jgi:hypothetical protein
MKPVLELVPIDDLKPNPRNPKQHANDTIDASLNRFGVIEPVVLDKRTGFLISGHGRVETLAAMRDSGHEPPEWVTVTKGVWKIPTVTSWASTNDVEAEAALIALNRSSEVGGWDTPQLAELLETLAAADLLDGVGYNEADLDIMRRVIEAEGQFTMDFTDVIDEFLDGTGAGSEPYSGGSSFRKITVVFPDEASVHLFFDALGIEFDATAGSIAYPHAPERKPLAVFDA